MNCPPTYIWGGKTGNLGFYDGRHGVHDQGSECGRYGGHGHKPGILISGHDLKDIEELLKQTEGTGVDAVKAGAIKRFVVMAGK